MYDEIKHLRKKVYFLAALNWPQKVRQNIQVKVIQSDRK